MRGSSENPFFKNYKSNRLSPYVEAEKEEKLNVGARLLNGLLTKENKKKLNEAHLVLDTSYWDYDTAYAYLRYVRTGVGIGWDSEYFLSLEQGLGIAHSLDVKGALLFYDNPIRNAYKSFIQDEITSSAVYPTLSMAYRYYYNLKKRIRQHKSVYKRSGSFIAVEAYRLFSGILTHNQHLENTLLNPQWGLYSYWGTQYTKDKFGINMQLGCIIYFKELSYDNRYEEAKSSQFLRYPIRASASLFYIF